MSMVHKINALRRRAKTLKVKPTDAMEIMREIEELRGVVIKQSLHFQKLLELVEQLRLAVSELEQRQGIRPFRPMSPVDPPPPGITYPYPPGVTYPPNWPNTPVNPLPPSAEPSWPTTTGGSTAATPGNPGTAWITNPSMSCSLSSSATAVQEPGEEPGKEAKI